MGRPVSSAVRCRLYPSAKVAATKEVATVPPFCTQSTASVAAVPACVVSGSAA
jgi:hypothetical protein